MIQKFLESKKDIECVSLQGDRIITLDAGFPNSVRVSEATNNIIADLDGKSQMVLATLFQSKPQAICIPRLRNIKNKIRSISSNNCEA